jgi:hypothetical protein
MKAGGWLFVVVLGLLLFIIWKSYWRIQMMYNSSILSFYTPDTFPIYNKPELERLVDKGERGAKNSKVVIVSLLRDVEGRIPEIKKKAERVGKLFLDYQIFIVENDSKDRTRELLLEWASKNPKVTILGCGYNARECSLPKAPKTDGHYVDRQRIEKMTRLRNIYLDEIKSRYSGSGGWDYVIMWDLDMLGSVYLDGIQHTLGYLEENPDVNVVCAYGIYRWGALVLFYDTYALLHPGEDFHIDMKTIHDIRKGWWEAKYQRGDTPFEVDSCFSGFAIYRTGALIDDSVFYDMSPPGNLECEHVRLNKKIHGRKVVNPSMINFVLLND